MLDDLTDSHPGFIVGSFKEGTIEDLVEVNTVWLILEGGLPGLRTQRTRAMLTQGELSTLAEVSESEVKDLERPRVAVASLTTIQRLSEALEIGPADLIYGEPTITPEPRD